MNIVNEISTLQTELESLRAENKILKEARTILDFENGQLKQRLAYAEAARDSHLASKVRLKTLLDQAGQQLVAGIQRYNNEAREADYDRIGEEHAPPPKFLQRSDAMEAVERAARNVGRAAE